MISPFVLTLVLSAVSGEPGLWMPTTGRAGERPLNALGAGGDGAIYATGGGAVYRLEPGADWRRIGQTAPRLRWDSDGEVEARGAFPPAVLAAVEAEASALLDFATVEGDEAQVAPERIAEALRDYVEEASENPASAHGVGRPCRHARKNATAGSRTSEAQANWRSMRRSGCSWSFMAVSPAGTTRGTCRGR